MEALSLLGFVDTRIIFLLEDSPVANSEQVTLVFNTLKDDLKKLQEGMPIDKMKKDVEVIIDFLEKNRELINHPNELAEPKHKGFEIRMTDSSPRIEDVVEKLKNTPSENIPKLIEVLYGNEQYSPAEIMDALDKWRKEK